MPGAIFTPERCFHGRLKKDPAMYHFTALVTCLSILFYFFTSIQVSKARAAFGIKAPTISGNPDFERVFRVQMNTLEWMPIFLPSLWLFAFYISDALAAALGLVWIIGRILYLTGYSQAAAKRGLGFGIQGAAAVLLWLGSLGAIIWRLIHA
jgi:glutathione S-transferase